MEPVGTRDRNPVHDIVVASILEARAQYLLRRILEVAWDASPQSALERRIALTLEHLRQEKRLQSRLLNDLFVEECYVDKNFDEIEESKRYFKPWSFEIQTQLHRRRVQIARERRQVIAEHARQRQSLEDRLLELLDRHELLCF